MLILLTPEPKFICDNCLVPAELNDSIVKPNGIEIKKKDLEDWIYHAIRYTLATFHKIQLILPLVSLDPMMAMCLKLDQTLSMMQR